MPLRVSCPGPLLRLACLGGGRSGPDFPLLRLGLWGWLKGVPGGAAFHCCEGRLRSGAPPPPTARPLGGLSGSATHVLWAPACWCGGPTLSPWPARSVGAACRGGDGGPSPYLTWGCAPPVGRVRGVRVPGGGLGGGEGGGPCAAPPVCAAGGACRAGGCSASFRPSAFPGQATKRVSLASHQSWGRGPHTTSVRARPPSLGAICAASWRVGAGSLVPRSSCGSWRLGRWGRPCSGSCLGRGEGEPSPLPLGVGAGAPAACGPVGGLGGGGRAAAPLLPLWGAARGSLPWPPSCHHRTPPRSARSVGVAGPPRGGGDEGRPVDRSPEGLLRPEPPLCPPRVGNGHGGGQGGRGLHTVLVRRRGPSPGLVRAPLWRAGMGSPVNRDPRGSRRLGAPGRAVCRSSRIPPPPHRGPFWGRGGVPSAPGGRRVAPVALKRGGGSGGGGCWGGRRTVCRPPAPSGVGLPSVVSGVPLRGILVPWGLPGARGRQARPGRPPMGQCGGEGEGGGKPLALVRASVFPRPTSEGAAPCAPSWAPPVRRRSAAGRAGACGRFTGGSCRGRGAPSARVQRSLGGGCGAAVSSVCLRPLLGLRGRGGGVGGALWSPGASS